ncbi:MAG: hypothetical protein P8Y58_14055, partial [Novosphingobium sp.]
FISSGIHRPDENSVVSLGSDWNIENIDPLLGPAVEQMQSGEHKPADVLNALAAKLNDGLIQGRYPTPKLS